MFYLLNNQSLNLSGTVQVEEMRLFWANDFPHFTRYLWRATDIAAVETTFNVCGYSAVLNRDSNPSPSRQRAEALRVSPQLRVIT